MASCKEYVLDDLMAVTAIPVANISASDTTSAANSLVPTISKSGFAPSLDDAITIGLQKAVLGSGTSRTTSGTLIPIRKGTGKAKDDESLSVSGRLHTVTVTCEVDDREISVWASLFTLERTPSHLLLTFRDGVTQGFVCGSEDTYLCNVERNGSKTSVTLRVQCLMGIQLLV